MLYMPERGLYVLTVVFQLICPELGIGSPSWWLFVDEYAESLTITNHNVDLRLNLIFKQMYVIACGLL